MSLSSIFNVARGALTANAAGLSVTGENISGANVAGHVRRRPRLETAPVGAGMAGGVYFKGVERTFDQFSYRNLVREVGLFGQAEYRSRALANLEPQVVQPEGRSLDDRFAAFFASLDNLALKADDPTARLSVLSAADDVATCFNQMSTALVNARVELLQQAQGTAQEINTRLEKIADLNVKILESRSIESSGKAELLDQRDQLVREVAERIDLTVVMREDGSVSLLSCGSSLVDSGTASTMVVGLDQAGDLRVELGRGGGVIDVSSKVTGGRLGGIKEARDRDVVDMQTDLDLLASDFGSAVNALHMAGVDLNGNAGQAFFTDPAGGVLPAPPGTAAAITLNPLVAIDPDRVAAAAPLISPPPGGNQTALLMSQLQDTPLGLGGTPAERFALFAGKIGSKAQRAAGDEQMRDATVQHAETLREQVSGVSLDEEMVNLTTYQRAFEASMRVLQAANEMLTTIVQNL